MLNIQCQYNIKYAGMRTTKLESLTKSMAFWLDVHVLGVTEKDVVSRKRQRNEIPCIIRFCSYTLRSMLIFLSYILPLNILFLRRPVLLSLHQNRNYGS